MSRTYDVLTLKRQKEGRAMNYYPLPNGPAAPGQTSREYWADRYADRIACDAVRNADLSIGPLRSRARTSLYREYFRRAHAEFLRKA
jgi:hypothetical protein